MTAKMEVTDSMLRNMTEKELISLLGNAEDPLLRHVCERMTELADSYEYIINQIKEVCDKAERHYEKTYPNTTVAVKVPVKNIISIIE